MPSAAERRADVVRQAVEDFVTGLDKRFFRPLQKESYLCSARACDTARDQASLQQQCQDCQAPVQAAEQILQQQLQGFQARLQRCAERCQDAVQEDLPNDPKPIDITRAEGQLENCIATCAETYQKQIPKMRETTQQQLKKLLTESC